VEIHSLKGEDEMRNEKGSVLALCMVLLVVVTLLAVAGMQTGAFGNRIAGNNLEGQKAFWIAEAGLQDAKDKLNDAASVEAFRNLTGLSNPVGYRKLHDYDFPDSFEPTRRVWSKCQARPAENRRGYISKVHFRFVRCTVLQKPGFRQRKPDHPHRE
jgi:hypothetical protein